MKKKIQDVILECVQGNIAAQEDIDAVVNAANAWLKPGGGVAGAIHRAAGPELYQECKDLAPIKPGQAVITKAYNLPNKYVIHCLGPVYGRDKPADRLLSDCYRNALKLAEENGINSIAFPAISTGVFGYPIKDAARVALETIIKSIPALKTVKKIRLVLYSSSDLKIYEDIMAELSP